MPVLDMAWHAARSEAPDGREQVVGTHRGTTRRHQYDGDTHGLATRRTSAPGPGPLHSGSRPAFRPDSVQDADDARLEHDTGFSRRADGTSQENGPAHQRARLEAMRAYRWEHVMEGAKPA